MKIHNEVFGISSKKRSEMIDVTGQVASAVKQSDITEGDVIVYCPHTTAAITINENADPNVVYDILSALSELVPHDNPRFRHFEGNSDAHCKSSLIGPSRQIIVKEGTLQLGTWQSIFFCEFDGPRSRRVMVQIRGQ
ncbi:MAG TPA: secondary thiamine-phosphate synthase enzyme YjbQ [Sedimentisphaerales bacterium]|nr:secondary thiamine-phosphate synthase enzyme YjbQ [Sedimentisphaerales bacterium]